MMAARVAPPGRVDDDSRRTYRTDIGNPGRRCLPVMSPSNMIRRPLVVPAPLKRLPSPNRNQISDKIGLGQFEPMSLPPTLRFVFLCFTNRCGSTYLGEILSST